MAKAAIPLFHSRLLGKAIVHERELGAELFRFDGYYTEFAVFTAFMEGRRSYICQNKTQDRSGDAICGK